MKTPFGLDDPTFLAIPLFVVAMLAEIAIARRLRGRDGGVYETRDTAASLLVGLGAVLIGGRKLGGWTLLILLALWERRIATFAWSWWAFLICFVLDDLQYYWSHRLRHSSRWFWAHHVAHHSSQHYNLSAALRTSWFGDLSGLILLKAPLVVLGFHPSMIIASTAVSLVYQFFTHTELVGRLPAWYEGVFVTPSHHRVHHSREDVCLDRNFGGVFIVWDRLFGTFQAEPSGPRVFGLVRNLGTFNPLRIATHEFIDIARDLVRPGVGLVSRAGYLFGPPGWSHDGSRRTTLQLKAEAAARMARAAPAE